MAGVQVLEQRDEWAGQPGVPAVGSAEGGDGEPHGFVGAHLDHEGLLTALGVPGAGPVREADPVALVRAPDHLARAGDAQWADSDGALDGDARRGPVGVRPYLDSGGAVHPPGGDGGACGGEDIPSVAEEDPVVEVVVARGERLAEPAGGADLGVVEGGHHGGAPDA
ncbi:hypothetical protein GCM10010193_01000 [Kitasatospora atroaurantiaca]